VVDYVNAYPATPLSHLLPGRRREEFRAGPGGLVFGPRGVPHAQRRAVTKEGRMLVLTAPAGLEGFFRELAAAHEAWTLGPDAYAEASQRYGITWLD
jgi:hypothetical protein